tara:strand:- start:129 stop:419 length:291 start_codon:yes stop_codon:yes gene_type:complete
MPVSLPWITPGSDVRDDHLWFPIIETVPKKSQGDTMVSVEEYQLDAGIDFFQLYKGGQKVVLGLTILAVPDPVPLVDEIIAIGLIGTGIYEVTTAF